MVFSMNLDKIYVILSHPDEPRNIGSSCRAMANCGISHLRIVGKKSDYDAEKVYVLAIHAKNIYDNAEFFDTITEATADCTITAGTTRRRGKKRKEKLYLPEEFSNIADTISGTFSSDDIAKPCGKVALVFGNERTGLSDDELSECTVGVTIPSSSNFPSLNLSHAVQIILYHLFKLSLNERCSENDCQNEQNVQKNFTGYTPLSLKRIDETVNIIADNLQKIGFFKVAGHDDMKKFWRSLLSRSAISESEAKYIEKIFTKASGLIEKNNS